MPNRRVSDGEVVVNEGAIEGEVAIPSGYKEYAKLIKDLDASVQVGGIDPGDHYDTGTLLEKILRDMIDPTLTPTLTNPSVTVNTETLTLLESGTSVQTAITANFNRGSINPAYGTSGYRSGPVTGYSINGSNPSSTHSWSRLVDQSHNSFTITASYEAGEQPKDEDGNDYDHPLPAGSVSTTLNFTFENAIWANINQINSIDKQPLVPRSQSSISFTFPPQTELNPALFDIPNAWTVTAIEVLNQISGKYEDCEREFSTAEVTHEDAGGNVLRYTRYRDNRGYKSDSRTIRVSWT